MEKQINRNNFQNARDAGLEFMSKNTVVICGVARDCSSQLAKLIPKIELLGAQFKSYKIIVVENDSRDGTDQVILNWARRNERVNPVIFSENKSKVSTSEISGEKTGEFGFGRISRIAYARNLYLQELKHYKQVDYVVIIDLDVLDFSIDGIANSFSQQDKWDCVAASGFRYTLRSPFSSDVYWDTYAYEPIDGFPDGVQRLADIRASQRYLRKKLRSEGLVEVLSAFGGLAIYRFDVLANQDYTIIQNNDPAVPVLCEHIALHRAVAKAYPDFRLVINPFQKLSYETVGTTIKRSLRNLLAS